MEPNTETKAPIESMAPMVNNRQKRENNLLIATVVTSIIAICGIGFGVFGVLQSTQKDKEIINLQAQINTLNEQINNKKSIDSDELIANTTWIASDGSEVVFSEKRIDWYQNPEEHSDNYYSGTYKFYIGKDATNYITQELSEYGVTESELLSLFSRNTEYSEDNFVVFDIRYDKFIMGSEEQTIARPLVPWYGFILDDNTYLDVTNMNTGTYYKFTKK